MRKCLCGCPGTPKLNTSRYLPGHDRRHLEQYVSWFESVPDTRGSKESVRANAQRTFSPALYAEFERRTLG